MRCRKYSVTVKSRHFLARSTTTDKAPALRGGKESGGQSMRASALYAPRCVAHPTTALARWAMMTILGKRTVPHRRESIVDNTQEVRSAQAAHQPMKECTLMAE